MIFGTNLKFCTTSLLHRSSNFRRKTKIVSSFCVSLVLKGSTSTTPAPTKKDVKQEFSISSPKHRSSITAASVNSVEYHHIDHPSSTTTDAGSISPGIPHTSAAHTTTAFSSSGFSSSAGNTGISVSFQQQQSLDQSGTLSRQVATDSLSNEADAIVAEPLEKILENKLIKEKRDALEKKLKALRKNHDKEKLKAATDGVEGGVKRSKFSMGNKLVKKLSSKNM